MRLSIMSGLIFACAAATAGAQSTATQTPTTGSQSTGSSTQTVTMVGCVGGGASTSDPFMLSNATMGAAASTTPGMPTTGATGVAGTWNCRRNRRDGDWSDRSRSAAHGFRDSRDDGSNRGGSDWCDGR